jgi:hypothetical protein
VPSPSLLPLLLLLLLPLLLCTAQGVVPSNAFKDFAKEEVETQVSNVKCYCHCYVVRSAA